MDMLTGTPVWVDVAVEKQNLPFEETEPVPTDTCLVNARVKDQSEQAHESVNIIYL
jgi:hypothetical protein